MANVNKQPTKITYVVDEDCVPTNVVRDIGGKPVYNEDGSYKTSGSEMLDPGPQAAKNQGFAFTQQVPKSYLISVLNPDSIGGIGRLSKLHVRAINTVLAKQLSGISYAFINPNNYMGKYQMSPEILTSLGYIKQKFLDTYGSYAVHKDDAWTGKDGISSLNAWFNSSGVQEKAMYTMMSNNYVTLSSNDGIKSDDSLCTIAGMLCVAHILGPDLGTTSSPGARLWRDTGGGTDKNGNLGTTFFSLGRYAIDVLAAKNK